MPIQRTLWPALKEDLDKPHITLIVGARQTGKTTLLQQCKSYLTDTKITVYFFSLEDPFILKELDHHPEGLFKFIPKDKPATVLIDEIQYLKDPTNFLKYIFDLYKTTVKLVVTGSSAFYIDKVFKDSLAGRKRIFYCYTYNFTEFLESKSRHDLIEVIRQNTGHLPQSKSQIPYSARLDLAPLLLEYVSFGGYPAVVHAESDSEKKEHLKELYFSFLKKDFLESRVRYEEKAYALISILAEQAGGLVNTLELANTLSVSHDTVKHYLYVLEKSFIITRVSPFFGNLRKELTKMPKYYFNDLGFRHCVVKNFDLLENRLDKGVILENLFFKLCLSKKCESIKFWRTQSKHEVDFILNDAVAYEIKFNEHQFSKAKYREFNTEYPHIPLQPMVYQSDTCLDILDFLE